MRFGFGELLVIFAIALFVLGPDKLPEYTRKLGAALKEFRKATGDATKDIRENIVEPLNEAQRPLREALEPLEEIRQDIDHDVNDIKNSLNSVTTVAPVRKVVRKNEETGEIEEVPVEQPKPAPEEEAPAEATEAAEESAPSLAPSDEGAPAAAGEGGKTSPELPVS